MSVGRRAVKLIAMGGRHEHPLNRRNLGVWMASACFVVSGVNACGRDAIQSRVSSPVCETWQTENAAVRSLWESTLELPIDVSLSAGVSVGDSDLIVFNIDDGHIERVDQAGRHISATGRSGNGPGEFARPRSTMVSYNTPPDWIALRSDSVFVFDGRSVHVRSLSGVALAQWPLVDRQRSAFGISTRLRLSADGAVVDIHRGIDVSDGVSHASQNRSFELLLITEDSIRVLERLLLPPLPRDAHGTVVSGIAEARVVWDLRAECIALMDGHSNELILINVRTGKRDSIRLPLSDRFLDARAVTTGLPQSTLGAELPKPALQLRIRELSLDPTGWVLLRPVPPTPTPESGIEVWMYHIPSARFVVDTVNVFPDLFDPSGAAFRATTTRAFESRLIRADHAIR